MLRKGCCKTCMLFSLQGKGHAGNISARLEPQEIALGDTAILAVYISDEQTGRPSISPVEGLWFFPIGQSSQYQSINGKISSTVRHVFENADAVAYFGQTFSQEELKQCRDLVIKELKNFENWATDTPQYDLPDLRGRHRRTQTCNSKWAINNLRNLPIGLRNLRFA